MLLVCCFIDFLLTVGTYVCCYCCAYSCLCSVDIYMLSVICKRYYCILYIFCVCYIFAACVKYFCCTLCVVVVCLDATPN
jgi:hypothetical protein